jgi:sarcosine oxidase, subunit alpha
MKRLPAVRGELIDRQHLLEFEFEGQRVQAFRGDTISSALSAAGTRILGRSFKYHRPRGVLSAAGHDVNALMQVHLPDGSIPNVRADVVCVEAGWRISAVNTWGGVARDRLALLERMSPLLPVGFYYKAFHGKRSFPHWERMFRRLAGLGRVDLAARRSPTPKRYDFCDVLVIGAGPSGLAAAIAAAERGAAVMLVDENASLGGSGTYARGASEAAAATMESLIHEVSEQPRIRVLTRTFAAGYYADHWVALVAPEHMTKARARSVIIAQGAWEQPAVFRGNDLPGVMLASAAQRLLYRYAVMPARRVAVITANAEGYDAALDGLAHGVEVAAVLDLRSQASAASSTAAGQLAGRGVPVYCAAQPIEARAGADGSIASLAFQTAAGGAERLLVDGLWMSVGFAPANALLHQANAHMSYDGELEQFVPQTLPRDVHACGKVNGAYGLEERIADGHNAGAHAAACLGFGDRALRQARSAPRECPTHHFPIFSHPRGFEFLDFDEDLHLADLRNACQEGFDSSELLKRFTTIGMGPSQGKHSNMNALRVLASVRREPLERLGTTTARPLFHPVPLSHLAGRGFSPLRRTSLDAEHEALGACWMPAGNWRRPGFYRVPGQSREQAIAGEVRAVRTACGLMDVGTLGKIELHGANAAELLERVYTGRFADLRVGMSRYGLMLDEAGTIVDDGVIARLGAHRYYFTTTTTNSAAVFRELSRLAIWWDLPVGLSNLTGHYGALNLAGPCARALLSEHTDLDLSDAAFPYQAAREATVGGMPCRLLRVGFVGELGYEIHLAAQDAVQLWRTLLASGARFGIQPFGVEAQRMLRLEKGHIIVGQDTDGLTNALEIQAPWALKMDKPFFVGQRSLRILLKQARRQLLVGFQLPPEELRQPKEGHLTVAAGAITGRVTSVGRSPTLGRCIGLALVSPEQASAGQLRVRIEGGTELDAQVVPLPFYDPQGVRQRAELPPQPGSALPASESTAPLTAEKRRPRARFGCKGPGADAWLRSLGYRVPQGANSAQWHEGVLVARLATSEFLVEAVGADASSPWHAPHPPDAARQAILLSPAQRVEAAARELSSAPIAEVYPVVRRDFVLSIRGSATGALLRQVCNVDFEPLWGTAAAGTTAVVLTSMIGVGVIAWPRRSAAAEPVVTLWIDPSFATYFSTTLLEVGRDLGELYINEHNSAE